MINEIIDLLPSEDLKIKIKEVDYKFSDAELLQIIKLYARSYEERLTLYERFSTIASTDISNLAKALIDHQHKIFKRFTEDSEGFVYELHIKETPYSHDERYICSSYETSLECIDGFYKEYSSIDAHEREETRYKIIKRKIFYHGSRFEEDEYAECVFGAGKKLLKIDDYEDPAECEDDISCSDCKHLCTHAYFELLFPCFAHNHDIIKYHDYEGKNIWVFACFLMMRIVLSHWIVST